MSSRIPPTDVLLRAAIDYREHEPLPTLIVHHRFQTRVSTNVLRTAMRALQLARGFDTDEHARLSALLGHAGDGTSSVSALNDKLNEAITSGRLALHAPRPIDHLCHTLADALANDNPKWVAHHSS